MIFFVVGFLLRGQVICLFVQCVADKRPMYDLPPYVDRCALIHLETLAERRANACVMFVFEILSGRVNRSNLLSLISINAPWYHTRVGDFLRVDFHRTNYGVHEPLNGAVRSFNEFAGLTFIYRGINFLIV
jgi:hypothetical protein